MKGPVVIAPPEPMKAQCPSVDIEDPPLKIFAAVNIHGRDVHAPSAAQEVEPLEPADGTAAPPRRVREAAYANAAHSAITRP